jgi:hypothetical protein
MYVAGERVAVYLKKDGDGWSTLQMTHLTEEYEPQWKAGVQPFLDVLLASESDTPEQRYAELLVAQRPRPQLTEASYYALNFNPDPRAAGPVREILLSSVAGTEHIGSVAQQQVIRQQATIKQLTQTFPQPRLQAESAEAATFPNTPLDLVTILAKMHDAESILPVLNHIRRLSDGERHPFLLQLPELCREADVDTLTVVQSELEEYAERYQGDKRHDYYQALVRVRASVDKLLENCSCFHPPTTVSHKLERSPL